MLAGKQQASGTMPYLPHLPSALPFSCLLKRCIFGKGKESKGTEVQSFDAFQLPKHLNKIKRKHFLGREGQQALESIWEVTAVS